MQSRIRSMFILTCILVAVMMHVAVPINLECTQYDGICQNTNIACDGNYTEGLCCGEADIQCCLPGDLGANHTRECNNTVCHERCRHDIIVNANNFLTGYCGPDNKCICSNDCRLVQNPIPKCLALCIEKKFTTGICNDTDHLCYCSNE